MNDNGIIDTVMNDPLYIGYVSNVIDLINRHTLPQSNESSRLIEINISVANVDVNVDYFCINSSTESFIKNHSSVD